MLYIFGRQSVQRPCQRAKFHHDTLKQAVAYCHARGVKVHLAVNTILLNHEIAPALDFVAFACTLPVDAVIVQDTGLLHLLRQAAPTLQIHASTQMSVHTRKAQNFWRNKGVHGCTGSRIIFKRNQRKLSRALKDGGFPHVEIDHFVPGALCMSVFGSMLLQLFAWFPQWKQRPMHKPVCLFPQKGGTGYDLSLKRFIYD